jgi:hypothetical protein
VNDSRKQFEEWFEPDPEDRKALRHWRTETGYRDSAWYINGCWAGWSARDAEVERLREALKKCLAKIDSEICTHEDTYRGGAIWTICHGCGMQWADDRGGFKPYQDPQWLTEIRSALSTKEQE